MNAATVVVGVFGPHRLVACEYPNNATELTSAELTIARGRPTTATSHAAKLAPTTAPTPWIVVIALASPRVPWSCLMATIGIRPTHDTRVSCRKIIAHSANRQPGTDQSVRAPIRSCWKNEPRSPSCAARYVPFNREIATNNTAKVAALMMTIQAGLNQIPSSAAVPAPRMRPEFHDTAPKPTAFTNSSRGTSDGIND